MKYGLLGEGVAVCQTLAWFFESLKPVDIMYRAQGFHPPVLWLYSEGKMWTVSLCLSTPYTLAVQENEEEMSICRVEPSKAAKLCPITASLNVIEPIPVIRRGDQT